MNSFGVRPFHLINEATVNTVMFTAAPGNNSYISAIVSDSEAFLEEYNLQGEASEESESSSFFTGRAQTSASSTQSAQEVATKSVGSATANHVRKMALPTALALGLLTQDVTAIDYNAVTHPRVAHQHVRKFPWSHLEDMLTSHKRFNELTSQWRQETAMLSSTTKIVAHPAYQDIILMGERAVPFILQDLEHKPDHWFVALNEITGADPVNPQDYGNMKKMAQDWIEWGKASGYLN